MDSFAYARISGIYTSVKGVAVKCGLEEMQRSFELLLEEKAHAAQPSIIVYGIYNHGKSTLINALIGKQVAETANRPMTIKVDQYQWNGYTICDTPGIDAPIEHEQIAAEMLRKSEVILFVLESGSMEHSKVWQEMAVMIKRSQHVCLIVNDRTNCMGDQAKINRLKESYLHHLQQAAEAEHVENALEAVAIFFINADAAQRAKLESKANLLKASGLPVLEEHLKNFFASLPAADLVKTLEKNLSDLLALCRLKLVEHTGDPRLEFAEKNYNRIEQVEKELRRDAETELTRRTNPLEAEIRAVLGREKSPEAIMSALVPIMERLGNAIGDYMKGAIDKTTLEVQGICQQYDRVVQKQLGLSVVMSDGHSNGKDSSLFDHASKLIPWESILKAADFENLVQKGVVELLKFGKELFPGLFKGIGAKTMGKWAAALSAALGPLIAVATTLWDIYSSYKKEQDERAAAELKEKMLTDAARDYVAKIRDEFSKQIDAAITGIFLPLKKQLTGELDKLRFAAGDSANDLKTVESAQSVLNAVQ